MTTTRRSFLSTGAAGLALGLAARDGAAAAPAIAATDTVASASERLRLIESAHFGRKSGAESRDGMAICTHPLASNEAVQVLREGGNAADAALAASITQTVVEPHMTTITGCLCLLYWDAATKKAYYCNGNVNAPLAEIPNFGAADIAGGRGVAVPAWWGGFEAAHDRFGSVPRRRLMEGAIRYARDGFETHPFLWGEMFAQVHKIGLTEAGREIYLPEGALERPGELLVQRRAADVLERLAEEGNDYFYRGDFAAEIVRVVGEAGGVLTREDFERYRARWQEPALGSYRGWDLVGSPPPDNGGTHIIEMLHMLENLDIATLGPPTENPEVLYQMATVANAVYSEGGRQRDPESYPLPLETLLSKDYARMRFELLQMGNYEIDTSPAAVPNPGSNHVTVADAKGNVCTILHSCMSLPWSNGLFADGVSICAAGAHFSRVMPKPGGRISAYVAPNMVLRGGAPVLASGSPSVGLLQNILQNTVNMLDFGLDIETSVHTPRFGGPAWNVPTPGLTSIEVDVAEGVRGAASKHGIAWDVVNPWNWLHGSFEGIWIDPVTGVMSACGDPRRTSQALAA